MYRSFVSGERGDSEVFRLRPDALSWRVLEGEVIALDLDSSSYLTANESGALLWQALAEGATHARLADILVETYGLPRERAAADVDVFLADAAARGLLA
jgi:coenzyme PQQ synthesis protein D (PqqD)